MVCSFVELIGVGALIDRSFLPACAVIFDPFRTRGCQVFCAGQKSCDGIAGLNGCLDGFSFLEVGLAVFVRNRTVMGTAISPLAKRRRMVVAADGSEKFIDAWFLSWKTG